jgi:putative ABC transport system substrate-binding protein
MKRREFIAGLGGAVAWPVVARAQQGDRIRRIGALMSGDDDLDGKFRVSAFTQALADVGWTDRNVRMDLRWGGGDNNRIRALAQELIGLQPDVIMTSGTAATARPAGDADDPNRLCARGRPRRQRHRRAA